MASQDAPANQLRQRSNPIIVRVQLRDLPLSNYRVRDGISTNELSVCTDRTLITPRYSLGLAITVKLRKAAFNDVKSETRLLVYRNNVRSVWQWLAGGCKCPGSKPSRVGMGADSCSMQAVSCRAVTILVDFIKRSRNLFGHDRQLHASVTKAPSRALATNTNKAAYKTQRKRRPTSADIYD